MESLVQYLSSSEDEEETEEQPETTSATTSESSETTKSIATSTIIKDNSSHDNDSASLRLKQQLLASLLQDEEDEEDNNQTSNARDDWLPSWASRPTKIQRPVATQPNQPIVHIQATQQNLLTQPIQSIQPTQSATTAMPTPSSQSTSVVWHPAVDKSSGDTYYYDPITKKTVWDLPAGDQLYSKPIAQPVQARPQHANSRFRPGNTSVNASSSSSSSTASTSSSSSSSSSNNNTSFLSEIDARKLAKSMAHYNNNSKINTASLMKMHTVDQRDNIAETMRIRSEMESKLIKDPSLLDSDTTNNGASFGKVWNRKNGEFGDALRVGQKSKSKHQIHSLVSDAVELKRKLALAGGVKRKKHSGNKYGW